jgi:hypothetical protein
MRRRRCRRKRSFHIQDDRKRRNLQSKNSLFCKEHHVPIVFVSSSGPEMGRFSQFSVQRSISLGTGPSSSSPSLESEGPLTNRARTLPRPNYSYFYPEDGGSFSRTLAQPTQSRKTHAPHARTHTHTQRQHSTPFHAP